MNGNGLRVGVVGVGVMGSAIATRLIERGHRLWLRDPDPAKTAPLVAKGAVAAPSAAALAAEVDYVVTSLNTAEIVERVVFGPEGIAAGAAPGKLLIDMSSIDPQATAAMAARLEAETGMAWVDAPLSGGAPAALEGRLTLMLGGSAAGGRARAGGARRARRQHHPHGRQRRRPDHEADQPGAVRLQLPRGRRGDPPGARRQGRRGQGPGGARRRPRRFAHPAGVHAEDGGLRLHARPAASTTCSRISRRCSATPWRCGPRCRSPASSPSCTGSWSPAGIGPEDSAAYMKLFDFGRGASAAGD